MPHRWNKAASIRKEQIESGKDITFSKVFLPYYESIVKKLKPRSLLEVGCGTGHLSLALSQYVATAHAIDPALDMYKLSEQLLKNTNCLAVHCGIENYSNSKKYDLIISHMCLNTVSNINTFINSISNHLTHNGLFIFSIPHPCFWHHYHSEWFEEFNYMEEQHLEVTLTITKDRNNPITNVPYIHRPLRNYFNVLNTSKLSVVGFDEIFPNREIQNLYETAWDEPRYCIFQTSLL